MIQRIQTIYLILVIAVCAAMFFLPIYSGTGTGVSSNQNQMIEVKQAEVKMNFVVDFDAAAKVRKLMTVLNTLDIVLIALSFVVIFLYKNRDSQLRMARYLILFSVIYIALIAASIFEARAMIANIKDLFGIGTFIPVLSPILLFLASRGIAKDIRLVKSSDRLR